MPDPKNIKDLNAYLSLWEEEKEHTLEQCVANCQRAEFISKKIVALLAEAKGDEEEEKKKWCIEYLDKIRSLSRTKINQITLLMLENVEKFLLRTKEEKALIESKSIFIIKIFRGHRKKGSRP